jgi:hypothetical protein
MKIAFRIITGILLAFAILCGSGIAPSAYNLIQANGSSAAIGSTLNFANATGVTWSCSTSGVVTTCQASASGSGTALSNYAQSFSSVTSVILTDNAGTTSKIAACYDNASPPNLIIPSNIAITDSNNTTVTFSSSQSGTCVVNSSGVSTGGGIVLATRTATTTTAFTSADYLVIGDTTAGNFTASLEASPTSGQIHVIKKKVAANILTLSGNGNNIDGAATFPITTQYESVTVQFDGTKWWIE